MASSVNLSYNLLKLFSAEEIGKFISEKPLSENVLAEKLTNWKQMENGASSSKDGHNPKDFLSLISELTQTSGELFSQKTEYRKYFHHLNHMQGRIWTYEDFSEKTKEIFKRDKKSTKELMESTIDVRNANSSKAEYWNPSNFLPLRIYSYALEFLKTQENNFVSPYPIIDKKKYSSCLAQQIASDIETLKYYNICQRIKKEQKEAQASLYQSLTERVKQTLENPVDFPNGYLVASGCSGHCLYVSLKIQKSQLIGTVFERGPFINNHESSETGGIPRFHPYIFSKSYTEHFLDQVLQNLREVWEIKIYEPRLKERPNDPLIEIPKNMKLAMLRIYQIETAEKVPVKDLPVHEQYSYTVQTASNCVLASHNISMLRIFGFQALIDHLIRKEKMLAAERSSYGEEADSVKISSDQLRNAEAYYQRAIELEKGPENGPPDWKGAFQNYAEAHKLGLREATAKLGFFYYYGLGTSPELKEGINLLKYSADEGDSFGQAMYGLACMLGIGIDADIKAAKYWLKRSADLKGQPGSLYAQCLLFGINQFTQKPFQGAKKEILDALRKAAGEGDVYANHLLVWEVEEESERSERLEQSVSWLFPDALMRQSYNNCLKDKIRQPLEDLLAQGYRFAAFLLGFVCLGEEKDSDAIKFFEKAADAGIAQSYAYLADLYLKKGNTDEAIRYLLIGTERGMANAMYGLGLAFLKIEEINDKNRGYEFLREAASRGSDAAKIELASRYENGFECVLDKVQAAIYRESIGDKPTLFPFCQLFQSLAFPKESESSSSSSSSITRGKQAGILSHHETIGPTGDIGGSYGTHRNIVLPTIHQETIGPTGGIGQNLPFPTFSTFQETRGLTSGVGASLNSIEKEKSLHPNKKSNLDDAKYTKHSKKKGKRLDKKHRTINQPSSL